MSSLSPPRKPPSVLRSSTFPASEASALLRDIEADVTTHVNVATSPPEVRRGFLKKVYSILALQLLLTTAICGVAMFVTSVRNFIIHFSAPILILAIVGVFVTLFALAASAKVYPRNILLLGAFTLLESVLMASVCAVYAKAGLGYLIFEAVAITFAIFIAITVYVFVSKHDFSFLGAALNAALVGLVVASLVNLFLGVLGGQSKLLAFLIAFGGSVLFSLFILYDTSLIIHHFGPDDALVAAIVLYTDLLNLFLQILALLSESALQDN